MIHGRLIIGPPPPPPPPPHARDTPESKANMLTQFPRIASEVLFAARCQSEQHDFVIIITYLPHDPPFPPPPSPAPSESPGPLRRSAALFMQHQKLQVFPLRQRAFSGASGRNPSGGVNGGGLGAADIKDRGFIWKLGARSVV